MPLDLGELQGEHDLHADLDGAEHLPERSVQALIGPPLSEADLTRMIGFDPSNRRRRHDARAAFERMEADGAIEIERDGTSWRLFAGPNW